MKRIAIIQRWSPQERPREQNLKSLALASKVKSLAFASKPTSSRKFPACDRGQLYFLICEKWAKSWPFVFLRLEERVRDSRKIYEDFFFLENTCALCPSSLASSIPVLGLERVGSWPRIVLCPWPWPRPRALSLRLHLCYYFFDIHLNGLRLGLTSAEMNCKEEQISRFFCCVFFYTAKSFQAFLSSWHLLKRTSYRNKLKLEFFFMNSMEMQRLIFILLLTIGVAGILDWRSPSHKSHAMTLSEIFKKKIFVERRYRRTTISQIFWCNKEDEKPWHGLPKVKKWRCLNWEAFWIN